jgi:hypothetical protein
MARRIKEEIVTKSILVWLQSSGWEIISFDFPQSGTGRVLQSNERGSHKSKNSFIPDIVAIKMGVVIFMENKDRFVLSDFEKLHDIKNNQSHSLSINSLLSAYNVSEIYFGAGFPVSIDFSFISVIPSSFVDFILNTDGNRVNVFFDKNMLF